MTILTFTAEGLVTLRRELLRHLGVRPGQRMEVSALPGGRIDVRAAQPPGSIDAFIGRLAGCGFKVACLEEIQSAATAGWAGEPGRSRRTPMGWCGRWWATIPPSRQSPVASRHRGAAWSRADRRFPLGVPAAG